MQSGNTTSADLRAALASVIGHHGGSWIRHTVRVLGNESDAEDVLQEAVRRVLIRNLPLSSEEQVKMYLGRAISNTAIEFYHNRKRQRMRQVSLQEQILLPANSDSPYTAIEKKEKCRRRAYMLRLLKKGLAQLPPKQYEALRLTILESNGRSIRDAGATSGIPYSTLRHRSKQGLRWLRRFLQRSLRSEQVKFLVT